MSNQQHKTKSNANCCVFGCTSVYRKNLNLSFHHFPSVNDKTPLKDSFGVVSLTSRRQLWQQKLRMGRPPSSSMRVCERHFLEFDYLTPKGYGYARRFLKKNAIPSQNLPNSCQQKCKEMRKQRHYELLMQRRTEKASRSDCVKSAPDCHFQPEVSNIHRSAELSENPENAEMDIIEIRFINVGIQTESIPQVHTKKDTIQVNSMVCRVSQYMENDLSIFSGISSLALLHFIIDLLNKFQEKSQEKKSSPSLLSVHNRILLVLMKMKHNSTYSALRIFFCGIISVSTCQRIFLDTVELLSCILESII